MNPRLATVYGWLLLMPAAILLIAFTHYPAVATLVTSVFTPGTPVRPGRFVGLDNYRALLDDPIFVQAAINNLWFAIGTVVPSIALAIVMALWVNQKIPARGLLRLAFFTPTILPMVAAANIWLFFYTPEIGLLDQTLGLVGLPGQNWLGDPDLVLPSLIVMTIWKEAGFFMIFYLAALQAIPPDLREAAVLEGTGRWTFFWRVTFPLLMPTTLFVLINALLNAFKLVDHLFILTKGGPNNASNLLLYYIYESAFSFFDISYAATITMVLLVFLALLAFAKFWLFEKRVHYR
jgi:sn-glycerol 3-phosphate transport system permease protein